VLMIEHTVTYEHAGPQNIDNQANGSIYNLKVSINSLHNCTLKFYILRYLLGHNDLIYLPHYWRYLYKQQCRWKK
jgi:hypothetical protein